MKQKKSRKGKNDPHTRPVISSSVPIFTEPFHNEDEFDVHFLKDEKRAKRCAACGVEFPKHPERYMYTPKKEGNTEWVYKLLKIATLYHC